ncbi:hypothetical protein V8E51_008622 [Hyaloscypha variabilis]|jgi:hypothetical protein
MLPRRILLHIVIQLILCNCSWGSRSENPLSFQHSTRWRALITGAAFAGHHETGILASLADDGEPCTTDPSRPPKPLTLPPLTSVTPPTTIPNTAPLASATIKSFFLSLSSGWRFSGVD